MVSYTIMEFNTSVARPDRSSRTEKVTIIMASDDISLTRDGEVVTIASKKSGKAIETPWGNVRFGERMGEIAPKSKKVA